MIRVRRRGFQHDKRHRVHSTAAMNTPFAQPRRVRGLKEYNGVPDTGKQVEEGARVVLTYWSARVKHQQACRGDVCAHMRQGFELAHSRIASERDCVMCRAAIDPAAWVSREMHDRPWNVYVGATWRGRRLEQDLRGRRVFANNVATAAYFGAVTASLAAHIDRQRDIQRVSQTWVVTTAQYFVLWQQCARNRGHSPGNRARRHSKGNTWLNYGIRTWPMIRIPIRRRRRRRSRHQMTVAGANQTA